MMSDTPPFDDGFDFLLDPRLQHRLLSANEEQRIDLLKWSAARRALRHLMRDDAGRGLLLAFCSACEDTPPEVGDFENRALYFHLRKDIQSFLPGADQAQLLGKLAEAIRAGEATRALLAQVQFMEWAATLMVGLAALRLRQLGYWQADMTADALVAWQPGWARGAAESTPGAAGRLQGAVKRFISARDQLVSHNLRLVQSVARGQQHRGIPLPDLIQEGTIGLLRAAEKYDWRRGFRFSTYAFNWINQHIQRAIDGRASLVTYPSHVVQEINQLHRHRLRHQECTGREPSLEQLAEDSGFALDKVRRLRDTGNITVSLDQPLGSDSELTVEGTLHDPDSTRAERLVEQSGIRDLLSTRLSELEDRERFVLCGRWGLSGQPRSTLLELAEQMNVSREWVRQIERTAMRKLRDHADLEDAYDAIAD